MTIIGSVIMTKMQYDIGRARSRGKLVIMMAAVVEYKRVSRQAREMEDLMLSLMLIMTLTAAVEINMSTCFYFVEIRLFDLDLGLQMQIVDPSRVELIGKRSIFLLETTINR